MGKVLLAEKDGVNVLKLVGDVRAVLGPTLSHFVNQVGREPALKSIVIDLTETDSIDSTVLGLLAKVSLRSQEALDKIPLIISTFDDVTRVLMSMGFDQVFVLVTELEDSSSGPGPNLELMGELPTKLVSEEVMCEQVLEAHQVLMSLNDKNAETFRDLVQALEQESKGRSRETQIHAVR